MFTLGYAFRRGKHRKRSRMDRRSSSTSGKQLVSSASTATVASIRKSSLHLVVGRLALDSSGFAAYVVDRIAMKYGGVNDGTSVFRNSVG